MLQTDEKKSLELFVFFGKIATGKSSISQAWAWHEQLRSYNSDWVRKELAGIDPTSTHHVSIDKGIYTREFSIKTYGTLLERATDRLKQGDSVILDASYQFAKDRQDLRALASRLGCRLYFIFCQCSEAEMKRRMEIRSHDPAAVSDGRWEIYLQQKNRFEPPTELSDEELILLNTERPLEEQMEELENIINFKRESKQ
jgi:predicted kinase